MTQLHLIMNSVKSQSNKVMKARNDYIDLPFGFDKAFAICTCAGRY